MPVLTLGPFDLLPEPVVTPPVIQHEKPEGLLIEAEYSREKEPLRRLSAAPPDARPSRTGLASWKAP